MWIKSENWFKHIKIEMNEIDWLVLLLFEKIKPTIAHIPSLLVGWCGMCELAFAALVSSSGENATVSLRLDGVFSLWSHKNHRHTHTHSYRYHCGLVFIWWWSWSCHDVNDWLEITVPCDVCTSLWELQQMQCSCVDIQYSGISDHQY